MSMANVATAVIVGGVGAYAANRQQKQAESAMKKARPQSVDPFQLNARIMEQARQNYMASQAFERQVNPALAAGRGEAVDTFRGLSQRDSSSLVDEILGLSRPSREEKGIMDALFEQAAQGGRISPDMQAEIVRGTAELGAGAGIAGSEVDRRSTARVLGISAEQLAQARRAAALQASSGLTARFQQGAATAANIRMQDAQTRASGAGSLLSIPAPQLGLDPGSLADIAVGNQNAQNQWRGGLAQVQAQRTSPWLDFASGAIGAYAGGANIFQGFGKSTGAGTGTSPSFGQGPYTSGQGHNINNFNWGF